MTDMEWVDDIERDGENGMACSNAERDKLIAAVRLAGQEAIAASATSYPVDTQRILLKLIVCLHSGEVEEK